MRKKKCICGKERNLSRGAAEAQIRGLKKLQTTTNGKKDFKSTPRLHPYRSRPCEKQIKDGREVWHVGHR
jgi:hypothetical protein